MTTLLLDPKQKATTKPRRVKAAPCTQMREMLATSRRHGVAFEKAWVSAYSRIAWPHDTEHRQSWKALLEAQKGDWERAYNRRGEVNRPLVALSALFSQYGSDRAAA